MKARMLSVAVLALALVLTVPSAAMAKGASAATINGPGLGTPVTLRGDGEPGAETRLAKLADWTGLFFAMFGGGGEQAPVGQILADRPSGDLGPRYTVTYDIPVDQGKVAVQQDLYPYARGGPVTLTRPGQRLWSGQSVAGGWFRGPSTLLRMLVSLGLPSKAPHVSSTPAPGAAPSPALAAAVVPDPVPSSAKSSAGGAGWWAGAGIAGGLLVVAALAVLVRRHRQVTPPR